MIKENLKKIVLNPEKIKNKTCLLKALLLKPRILDLISFCLQCKDILLNKTQRQKFEKTFVDKVASDAFNETVKKPIRFTRRSEFLYEIIKLPLRDLSKEKILVVGPQNIHELIIAWLTGFKWNQIISIDLFSLSSKIQIMDVHSMSFQNEQFNNVMMSAVFCYIESPEKVLQEVARVLKVGGHFVFNSTTMEGHSEWPTNSLDKDDLMKLLKKFNLEPYFYYSIEKINKGNIKQNTHYFGCIKIQSSSK